MRFFASLVIAVASFNSSVSFADLARPVSTVTNGSTEISVMAYNVANLFDTTHDAGKEDWAYLPRASKDATVRTECDKIKVYPWRMECLNLDWTPAVLAQKISRVSHAILSVNNGRGPDVLLLEEVENIGVLNQLNAALGASAYTSVVLIEGNDDRGIDQAMLSRLPIVGKPVNDAIPLASNAGARKEPGRTRGLLQTTFQLPGGALLTVFGVHFPSGDAHDQRAQAVEFLNEKRASLPSDRMVMVGGDFNINSAEDSQFDMYSSALSPWLISHKIGCRGCQGTEYYKTKKEWSFLDALGFSPNMDWDARGGSWSVDDSSISIPVLDSQMISDEGTPQSFDAVKGTGVSDHFPIFSILRKR